MNSSCSRGSGDQNNPIVVRYDPALTKARHENDELRLDLERRMENEMATIKEKLKSFTVSVDHMSRERNELVHELDQVSFFSYDSGQRYPQMLRF